jgi:hypothetical protein
MRISKSALISTYVGDLMAMVKERALKDHAAIENAKKVIYRVALVW